MDFKPLKINRVNLNPQVECLVTAAHPILMAEAVSS